MIPDAIDDTIDGVVDPEEVLFDDEKDVTEDTDDTKMEDESEVDTFDDVIIPEEALFDDEKDDKIPETIDNDVEDLEGTLFEDDKQVDIDSETDQMTKEIITEDPLMVEGGFEDGFEDDIVDEVVTTMQPIFDGESKVPVDEKEVCNGFVFLIM